MKLSGKQIGEIQKALLDAYPTRDDLRIERHGRIAELIEAAYDQNRGNASLQQFVLTWRAATASAPNLIESQPITLPVPSGPASVDVFLSYSRKNLDAMSTVKEVLRSADLSVWTDEDLEAGTPSWTAAIEEAIDQAQAVVVLMSPESKASVWVEREVTQAQNLSKRILPILISGDERTAVPFRLNNLQWMDGRQDLQQGVEQRLLPELEVRPQEPVAATGTGPEALSALKAEQLERSGVLLAEPTAKRRPSQRQEFPRLAFLVVIAIVVGATALYVVERFLFPPVPPAIPPATVAPVANLSLEVPEGEDVALLDAQTTTAEAVGDGSEQPVSVPTEAPVDLTPTANSESTIATTDASTPGAQDLLPLARTALPATTITPTTALSTLVAVSTPTPVPGATISNPTDGAVYVYVPAGPFVMGSSEDDPNAEDDEKPQQPDVYLDAFWIMQTEVTNAQYEACVQAGGCSAPSRSRWNNPNYAQHPVTWVSWYQANEYAQWTGGRLPTEAEWEKACRGTEGGIYPWGDEPPTAELAYFDWGVSSSMPAGSYPLGASPYGILDMAGNVLEWTSSRDADYPYDPSDGREEQEGDYNRVLRGGSFGFVRDVRCAARWRSAPGFRYGLYGFRVVLSP